MLLSAAWRIQLFCKNFSTNLSAVYLAFVTPSIATQLQLHQKRIIPDQKSPDEKRRRRISVGISVGPWIADHELGQGRFLPVRYSCEGAITRSVWSRRWRDQRSEPYGPF